MTIINLVIKLAIALYAIQQPVAALDGKALTWAIRQNFTSVNGNFYVLFGHGEGSNAYVGDTSINERRSLLCVRRLPGDSGQAPPDLPPSSITPGGADMDTWSKKAVMIIPNVLGSSLESRAIADRKCRRVGREMHGITNFRMAEFHDGTGRLPGWSFWAQAFDPISGLNLQGRFWVAIDDQPANPWNDEPSNP